MTRHARALLAIALLLLTDFCASAEQATSPRKDALALLASGDYAGLDGAMQTVQNDYKRGSITDAELLAAFRPFYSVEKPALERRFDEWVKLRPGSYVARLARGIHHKYVGLAARGNEFIDKTSDAQLAAMRDAFDLARKDLDASLELDDKPLLSYLHLMDVAGKFGRPASARRLLERANEIDPHNFVVRRKYMLSLQTRWGGSVERMKGFVEECRRAGLSTAHIHELESAVAEDEAWVAYYREKNYAEVVRLTSEWLEHNPADVTIMQYRLPALMQLNRYDDAILTASNILQYKPHDADTLGRRGRSYLQVKKGPEAVRDYQEAAGLGDAYAQKELARLYWQGLSVPKDRTLALEWLRKAALQGDPDARRELQRVAAQKSAAPPTTSPGSR